MESKLLERQLRNSPWNLKESEIRVLSRMCETWEQAHTMLLEGGPEFRSQVRLEEQWIIEQEVCEEYFENNPELEIENR